MSTYFIEAHSFNWENNPKLKRQGFETSFYSNDLLLLSTYSYLSRDLYQIIRLVYSPNEVHCVCGLAVGG